LETEKQAAAPGRAPPVRQLAAALIDWILLLGEPVVVMAVIFSRAWPGGGVVGNWDPLIYTFANAIPWMSVVATIQLVLLSTRRATLGHGLMRLRVVRLDGTEASMSQVLGRSFGWIIGAVIGPWSGMIVWYPLFQDYREVQEILSFLTFFFVAYASCSIGDRRTLGDLIAGTALKSVTIEDATPTNAKESRGT
jgi:uncharacterized RDD family membrane protein YckC